ncbi:MAG: hypothetical protein AAB466_00880 [Verrucomicrobiota bacterium]
MHLVAGHGEIARRVPHRRKDRSSGAARGSKSSQPDASAGGWHAAQYASDLLGIISCQSKTKRPSGLTVSAKSANSAAWESGRTKEDFGKESRLSMKGTRARGANSCQ